MGSFLPSPEMISFRALVLDLRAQGMWRVGQWVRRVPFMTMATWDSWWETEGFQAWWVEEHEQHTDITAADLLDIQTCAIEALRKGLKEGHASALQVWTKLETTRMRVNAQYNVSIDAGEGLARWFGGDPEKHWKEGGYVEPVPEEGEP